MKRNTQKLKEKEIARLRKSNTLGDIIPLHHSLATIPFRLVTLLTIICLPLLVDGLLYYFLNVLLEFWNSVFGFWNLLIFPVNPGTATAQVNFFGTMYPMPYPKLTSFIPSKSAVGMGYIISCTTIIITFFTFKNILPLTYFLRALALIQVSASIYFTINPDTFPYTLEGYIVSQLSVSVYMMFIITPLLALIYYPLDFTFKSKLLLTLISVGYFIIAIPCQYMLHAYVINKVGFIILPTFYLMFGLLLDVLMLVCFYSWAMTWQRRVKN